MTAERALRTIAVAGGGIAGLSAAIAFARSLPGTTVTLIETGPDPAALADLVPVTWPSVARFHAAIGLDELELVRTDVASHHLGTIFEDWSASGDPWVHAFGNYGKPADGIPFDQAWYRARVVSNALAYDRYSVGAALACEGKFVHPATDPNSLGSRFQYGLRLDPDRYRDRLKRQAVECGVAISGGEIADIEQVGGAVGALLLTDGRRVQSDLFVDCTGPSARLITAVDDSFEDWSAWMPFDCVVVTSISSGEIPLTADRARAEEDGWSLEWPLRGHTVRARLRISAEGVPILRGRRLRPWVRNVLALGDAATALDPLHGFNLELTQRVILLALDLLPGRDFHPAETEEYNRRSELVTRRVRDFVALHYLRSGRCSGVWADLAEIEPPDTLAQTLDQYEYRGRLPFHEEESVTRDSWTAALLGMGVNPRNTDPAAAALPLEKVVGSMGRLQREIGETIAGLPDYGDYLARINR